MSGYDWRVVCILLTRVVGVLAIHCIVHGQHICTKWWIDEALTLETQLSTVHEVPYYTHQYFAQNCFGQTAVTGETAVLLTRVRQQICFSQWNSSWKIWCSVLIANLASLRSLGTNQEFAENLVLTSTHRGLNALLDVRMGWWWYDDYPAGGCVLCKWKCSWLWWTFETWTWMFESWKSKSESPKLEGLNTERLNMR